MCWTCWNLLFCKYGDFSYFFREFFLKDSRFLCGKKSKKKRKPSCFITLQCTIYHLHNEIKNNHQSYLSLLLLLENFDDLIKLMNLCYVFIFMQGLEVLKQFIGVEFMEMMRSHRDFRNGPMAIQMPRVACFVGSGDFMLLPARKCA